jgi:hypothetical protein
MIPLLVGMVPLKPLLIGASIGKLNKDVIFPSAKKIASATTRTLGLASEQDIKASEKYFDELVGPVNNIIQEIEGEVFKILVGDWVGLLDGWRSSGTNPEIVEETLISQPITTPTPTPTPSVSAPTP